MARSKTVPPSPSRRTFESFFEHAALFEFSRVINSSLDRSFILNHILLTIMGKMLATKGMVLLRRSKGEYAVVTSKGLPAGLIGTAVTLHDLPLTAFQVSKIKPSHHPWVHFFSDLGLSVLLPLVITDEPIGILAFGRSLSKRVITEREETYFRSLANISASAVRNCDAIEEMRIVNRRLDLKVQELNTLFELGKEFGTLLDPEKQVRLLVFSLLGQIGVNRYLICIRQEADMRVVASRLDGPQPQSELLAELSQTTSACLVQDLPVRQGTEVRDVLLRLGMKAVIPMMIQGEIRGLILVGEKLSREDFTPGNLEFLSSLGNLAMISLENSRLFKEALEKQKMEDELLIAREIQKGLLPNVLPSIPGIEVAAANISSKQVGGDYYDVLKAPGDAWIVAIGDVSGKGTPAALLMANLQATIRALVPLRIPLSRLTGDVNDLMCENTGGSKFVTFFWGAIDPERRTLTYVNAGHNYPFLLREDGTIERLEAGGMILGVLKTATPYEEASLDLQSGDTLVLFTDGVSEAMNKDLVEYGESRLEVLLRTHRMQTPQEIVDAIHTDVRKHVGGAPQSDDITLMVIKVH
jgi:sigma-B regulation protein RsbU (phosphoserine phosphatase)